MNYFSGKNRPDIFFDSHQCAKYSIDPKQSHEKDVNSIGHYLKKTVNKCLEFTPNGSNGIECYANADFTGAWCREDVVQVGSFSQKRIQCHIRKLYNRLGK